MGKLTKNQKLTAGKIEAGKAYSLKESILTEGSCGIGKRNHLYQV